MKKNNDNKNIYNDYINKLNEIYKQKPNYVIDKLHNLITELENNNNNQNGIRKILNEIGLDKIIYGLLIFIIIITGLFSIKSYILYIFGCIFFFCGYFISMNKSSGTIIFLFSHGVTGAAIMEVSLLTNIITNPIMTDNPLNIYIYIGISIFILVIATIIVVIYNLSNYFRSINHTKLIPITLYTIGFFLAGLLNILFNFIYNI